jgi:hypothetical protein
MKKSNKQIMKKKLIKLEVFSNWKLTLYLGKDEEIMKEVKKRLPSTSTTFVGKCVTSKRGNESLIFIKSVIRGETVPLENLISTLTHELSHSVDKLFERLNIGNDTEVRAYIMGWGMQKFLPVLIKEFSLREA